MKRRRPAGRGSSITKILVADEHGIVRDGLRSLLEKHHDMRVVAAVRDGREAVAAAERFMPDSGAVREVAAGKRYLGNSVADKVFDTLRRRAQESWKSSPRPSATSCGS